MTDDDLARALRDAPRTRAEGAPLDADWIRRAATGQLSPEETAAAVDRVAADPSAAVAWRLARELPAPPSVRSVHPGRAWTGWALAAAAGLLAGAVVHAWIPPSPRDPGPSAYRGAAAAPVLAVDPSAGGPALRWAAVPGARYEIVLLDPTFRAVETWDPGGAPTFVLPTDTWDRLGSRTGFVQLQVHTVDGTTRSAPVAVGAPR